MNWFYWVLIGHFALGGIGGVYFLNNERPKMTTMGAILGLISSAFFIAGILRYAS